MNKPIQQAHFILHITQCASGFYIAQLSNTQGKPVAQSTQARHSPSLALADLALYQTTLDTRLSNAMRPTHNTRRTTPAQRRRNARRITLS